MSDEKMAFDEVVAFFNEQMKGKAIPQVAIITQQRRQAFDTLIETTGIDIMSVWVPILVQK